VTTFTENIAQNISRMKKLLETSGQLWTKLLEDGILQEIEGKEDKFHTTIENVKKRQRTMSFQENIKAVIEMKNLHAEEKVVQE
jgi:hypothetical protein